MMGTSSYILARVHAKKEEEEGGDSVSTMASEHSSDYITSLLSKVGITDPSHVTEFVVPRMLKAVTYLQSRDIDNDGLLEQKHNEDWMDTLLRTGKVVYSQACWILALKNLATVLRKLGNQDESRKLEEMSSRAISAVEE